MAASGRRNLNMLKFLLAHPEYSFSPPEVFELCEAFDAALVALHEEHRFINWSAERVTAALAAEIAESRLRGERDPKRLRDNAVRMARTLFETAEPEPPKSQGKIRPRR
jgi:hypothetical protein